jgi:hypothetical protein
VVNLLLTYVIILFSVCRFIADCRIFVVGFGLYGSIHGPTDYDVTLQASGKSLDYIIGCIDWFLSNSTRMPDNTEKNHETS